MNLNYLSFEQPIAELEAKIEELQLVGNDNDVNIAGRRRARTRRAGSSGRRRAFSARAGTNTGDRARGSRVWEVKWCVVLLVGI